MGRAIPCNFTQLFSDKIPIHVPLFQRRYCWTESQWNKLWKDIESLSVSHHFGRLIFAEETNSQQSETKWICVDGQQRLSTVMVILAASLDRNCMRSTVEQLLFFNIAEAKEWNANNETVPRGVVLPFCRFIPTFEDRQVFFSLLLEKVDHLDQKVKQHSALYQAFETFRQKMKNLSDSQFKMLLNRLISHFQVVQFFVDDDEQIQQMFENLYFFGQMGKLLLYNAAPGIDLSAFDLVRNRVLKKVTDASKQLQLYEEYWLPFESLFLQQEVESQFLDFLVDYTKSFEEELAKPQDKSAKPNPLTVNDFFLKNVPAFRMFLQYFEHLLCKDYKDEIQLEQIIIKELKQLHQKASVFLQK